MKEYPRNIAIVGSALYGGILVIGFLIVLLFEGGSAFYTRYSPHASTFLVFSFHFMPTVLFMGATVPWIGAVYGSPTAEIVLVVIPGGLFVLLTIAWFCIANNETMYHGERRWMEDDAMGHAELDRDAPLYDHTTSGILASPPWRGHGAYFPGPSLMSVEVPPHVAPRVFYSGGSPGSHGPLPAMDVDSPLLPHAAALWPERLSAPSPLTSARVPPLMRTTPSFPSVPSQLQRPGPSMVSAPSPDLLTAAEAAEAQWRRQQYIATQRRYAGAAAGAKSMEGPTGALAAPSRASTSVGSLYVNTLPSAAAAAAAASHRASLATAPSPDRTTQTAQTAQTTMPRSVRAVSGERHAPPRPAAYAVLRASPPAVPLQEAARPAAVVAAHRHRSPLTATATPLGTSPRPVASRTSPQHIYIDVPFATELRD